MAEMKLGSEGRPARVAIVGAGPAGFSTAETLLKTDGLHARIDLFERLPAPFGLVRNGVAPDHQQAKSVIRGFERTARHPALRFFGNVMLGRDLRVEDLNAHYDCVVYATGAERPSSLGIPGEDLQGVYSAAQFVGWYNAHPDYCGPPIRLDGVTRAAVVGNGNVAIDAARVLARLPEELAATDIAEDALDTLRRSALREVLLLGRRGPAQAAFSPRELREILDLAGVAVVVDPADAELDEASRRWLAAGAPPSAAQNFEILRRQAAAKPAAAARILRCCFRVSPREILGRGGRVVGMRLERNVLSLDENGAPRAVASGEFSEVDVDLVIVAAGYRGVPLPGLPFDANRAVIPNDAGRVLASDGGAPLPGQYAAGWAATGPVTLIGASVQNARKTAERLAGDVVRRSAEPLPAGFDQAVPRLLARRGVDCVTFADWERLDRHERERGASLGKPRCKIPSTAEMLRLVLDLRRG
ncbi:MAG: FAD-dependent oxidoreductase [Planctomycetes bacterium]|nr:FAD-dependent oxidoreductase [Planctomycetota bacterium]